VRPDTQLSYDFPAPRKEKMERGSIVVATALILLYTGWVIRLMWRELIVPLIPTVFRRRR